MLPLQVFFFILTLLFIPLIVVSFIPPIVKEFFQGLAIVARLLVVIIQTFLTLSIRYLIELICFLFKSVYLLIFCNFNFIITKSSIENKV